MTDEKKPYMPYHGLDSRIRNQEFFIKQDEERLRKDSVIEHFKTASLVDKFEMISYAFSAQRDHFKQLLAEDETPYTVYKIIRSEGHSIYANYKARCYYKQSIEVTAPEWLAKAGYHLTAFAYLNDAERFQSACQSEIWKAEGKGIIIDLPPRLTPDDLDQVALSQDTALMRTMYKWSWPVGTIMVKRLTLVERIQ